MKKALVALTCLFIALPAIGKTLSYSCATKDYRFYCSDTRGDLYCYECVEITRTHSGLRLQKRIIGCDCASTLIRVDRDCARITEGGLD